jgi:hypothetical protein
MILSRSPDDGRLAAPPRSEPRLEHIKPVKPMWPTPWPISARSRNSPYAILGPKRLGYAAGVCCHGPQMVDYITCQKSDR